MIMSHVDLGGNVYIQVEIFKLGGNISTGVQIFLSWWKYLCPGLDILTGVGIGKKIYCHMWDTVIYIYRYKVRCLCRGTTYIQYEVSI